MAVERFSDGSAGLPICCFEAAPRIAPPLNIRWPTAEPADHDMVTLSFCSSPFLWVPYESSSPEGTACEQNCQEGSYPKAVVAWLSPKKKLVGKRR